MKKFTLFLSAMTMAAGAFAAAPEVGSHYVIKSNRGGNYLAYDAAGLVHERITDYTTHLYRTGDVAANCLWTVSAGTAEGTVVLKNYTADAYLVAFTDELTSGAYVNIIADTTEEPVDLSITECASYAGAYSISIANTEGNVSIDADNWNNTFCGSWIPNDGGTAWFFTAVEIEGDNVENALFAQVVAKEYIDELNVYSAAVPAVKSVLDAAIAEIEALEGENATAANAAAIKAQAIADAGTALETCLDGQTYVFLSPRRAATATAESGPYMYTNTTEGQFWFADDSETETAYFTFQSVGDGGYVVYNAATQKFIGQYPAGEGTLYFPAVDTQAEAQVVYPILFANGGYTGAAFPLAKGDNSRGFNVNSWKNEGLTAYAVADGGSIWHLVSVVEDSIDSIVAEKATVMEGIYDLSGRKLAAPVRGINIINGVKVLVK